MSCKGLHCPGCGDGGGGILAAIAAVIIVGVIIAKPAARAASELLHAVLVGLEITAVGVVGVAMVGGSCIAYRRHQRREAITPPIRVTATVIKPPAIEAPQEQPAAWPYIGMDEARRP